MIITTNDLFDLINLSTNSEQEKENYRDIVSNLDCEVKEAVETSNSLLITFKNCTTIELNGITFTKFLRPHYA